LSVCGGVASIETPDNEAPTKYFNAYSHQDESTFLRILMDYKDGCFFEAVCYACISMASQSFSHQRYYTENYIVSPGFAV